MIHRGFFVLAASLFLLTGRAADTYSNAPAILESNIAWLRVSRVEPALTNAAAPPADGKKIIGLILDLRFANGDDFAAARAAATAFAAEKLPVAILVNSQTRGAAVALASELRAARAGLVFGGTTEPVSAEGETFPALQPDITVAADLNDERVWRQNPYAKLTPDETNALAAAHGLLPFVDHTSEADLVREQRQFNRGPDSFPSPAAARPRVLAPSPPVICDPVLARGADFLKGWAVFSAAKR